MKKIFIYLTFAAAALTMQSCLHDNEDTFALSAAERIDKAVADAKALLESADNGWKLEYYLGSEYSYGGFNYLVKFGADGKASGTVTEFELSVGDLTDDERKIILAGCLINYYRG